MAVNEVSELEKLKQVRVKFVGSDDVIQHIVPLKQKRFLNKTPKKNRRVSYARNLIDIGDGKDYDDDDDLGESDVDSVDENKDTGDAKPSNGLFVHGDGVIGSDLFSFRTPKKNSQMLVKASESVTPKSVRSSTVHSTSKVSKTPKSAAKSEAMCKTPTSVKRLPRSILKKTPVSKCKAAEVETPRTENQRRSRRLGATTPHRLWKRNKEDVSSSSDSCVSSDEDEPAESEHEEVDSSEHAATPSSSFRTPSKRQSQSSSAKGATPSARKSEIQKRGKKLVFNDETVTANSVESYFEAQSSAAVTSDRTLSRLETPAMDPLEMSEALKDVKFKYEQERMTLRAGYRMLFDKWMYCLSQGYNLLLHGLGSKYGIMDEFRKAKLEDCPMIVVNGYFPSLSIKSILNTITEDILEHSGSFSSPVDQCDFIRQKFESKEYPDIYLVVHNIDGAMLRLEKSQVILSLLAQIRGFHFVASIDHINAPLLWDQTKICRFRWLWQDVTTFDHYAYETSYENSLLVRQTGGLVMSSLIHVMKSLTPNARGIFLLLAKYQLDNQDNSSYQGLAFPDLYQRCREAFLVNSELTLRSQLTEFKDHKLIRTKKGLDGVDHLVISVDSSTLGQYVETESESR